MMKLSLAIRLGAMRLPRSDAYLKYHGAILVACCAAGGAALARGYDAKNGNHGIVDFLRQQWPFLESVAIHPVRQTSEPVENIINSLNGSYRWTRERIADWVATIEPQEVTIPEEVAHEPVSAST